MGKLTNLRRRADRLTRLLESERNRGLALAAQGAAACVAALTPTPAELALLEPNERALLCIMKPPEAGE